MYRDTYPRFRTAVFLFCAILIAFSAAVSAQSNRDLLLNGDFAKGSGNSPDNWRTEAWINKPEAFNGLYNHADAGSTLEVDNLQANDARWMQSLSLSPGWYQLSVDIRTENVGGNETGATISVMEDGISSPDVRGTNGWRRQSLYLKIGGHGADIDVALRVGGFGSLNTGRAFFRNATLTEIAAPPAGATPLFDLAAIRQQDVEKPVGGPLSLVITLMLLAAGAYCGARLFAGENPFAALRSSPGLSRAEKRRLK
jgi:dolichyl-phosphate-mannose-protein mannosyltransferase